MYKAVIEVTIPSKAKDPLVALSSSGSDTRWARPLTNFNDHGGQGRGEQPCSVAQGGVRTTHCHLKHYHIEREAPGPVLGAPLGNWLLVVLAMTLAKA